MNPHRLDHSSRNKAFVMPISLIDRLLYWFEHQSGSELPRLPPQSDEYAPLPRWLSQSLSAQETAPPRRRVRTSLLESTFRSISELRTATSTAV